MAAVVLLGVTAFRSGNQDFDKITVREFELVDVSGKKRASIKVEPEGEVVFRLFDENQTIRVKVGADANGSGVVLLDQNTDPGLQVLAKESGNKLTLFDKTERSANTSKTQIAMVSLSLPHGHGKATEVW